MIIAGNCLHTGSPESILQNAEALKRIGVDRFRAKLYGGGSSPEKYNYGVGDKGYNALRWIDNYIMPAGTEIHTPEQILDYDITYVWVGARNSRNYTLLKEISKFKGDIMLKRGADMTIDETIGIFDICKEKHGYTPYIIERGILIFDRLYDSRWSPDLKGIIRIKEERPDIFKKIVLDCSHSVGRKEYIKDTYEAFKAIGVKHYMFESTIDGESDTDQRQMLSIAELKEIIK